MSASLLRLVERAINFSKSSKAAELRPELDDGNLRPVSDVAAERFRDAYYPVATPAVPSEAPFKLSDELRTTTGVKQCPACSVAVVEPDGCNTVTCYSCNVNFCFSCLWHNTTGAS